MKFLLTNTSISNKTFTKLPFEVKENLVGGFNLITEKGRNFLDTTFHYSITDGYLRDLSSDSQDPDEHTRRAVEQIQISWPVPENITGSFSTTIIDKNAAEVIICNDLIGVYPLYYLENENDIYISNSIILMAFISRCDLDEVGIAQRCIGPEFSNMGSRTILKNCKRLLPGEYLKMDAAGSIIHTKYDNSLYQNISTSKQGHNLHLDYWANFKKEVDYCLIGSPDINIALSGGLDSRLLLGALSDKKKITGLTYGEKENYETKIASRLAKVKKADFKSFSQLDLYFPPAEILKKYTLETEAVNICSWLEILENIKLKERNPLLLGDMAEAISARNIKKFSTRHFRQDNFLKYYLFKKDYQFEKSDSYKFEKWKKGILHHFDRWYTKERVSNLNLNNDPKQLVAGLHLNLKEIFSRIEAHQLPFVELYDELFSWYTHSRIPMSKQILICNRAFYSFCPPMSHQIIRNTSNIHPNLRLGNRFLNKLFTINDLKKLNKIPTSQAPLVPQTFPVLIKFPVWGIRSKIDHYYINRLIKSKDPTKRYRLFSSLNWAKVYQNPDMEENLKSYFSNNHLGEGYFKFLQKRAIERKNLKQWPFANTEMINGASLNMEIDLIKSLKQEDNI